MDLPFRCPADHVLNMEALHAQGAATFRESSFLRRPEAERILRSKLTIHVCDVRRAACWWWCGVGGGGEGGGVLGARERWWVGGEGTVEEESEGRGAGDGVMRGGLRSAAGASAGRTGGTHIQNLYPRAWRAVQEGDSKDDCADGSVSAPVSNDVVRVLRGRTAAQLETALGGISQGYQVCGGV